MSILVIVAACAGGSAGPMPVAPAAGPAVPSPGRVRPLLPKPVFVNAIDLAPAGRIELYAAHLDDGRRCWTFVTAGRAATGRPELVLSVLADPTPDAPPPLDAAVALLGSMMRSPTDAFVLGAWDSASVPVGLFGRADLDGIAAIPAAGPQGVPLPSGALTVVLLTSQETEVAAALGATRVLGRLGQHERFYPAPWWNDLARTSSVVDGELAASAWAGFAQQRAPGVRAQLVLAAPMGLTRTAEDPLGTGHGSAEGTLFVGVERARAAEFARLLAQARPGTGLALVIAPDATADSRLVWGATARIETIGGPAGAATITSGLLLLGLDDQRRGGGIVEDGFVIILSGAERDALVAAIRAGTAYDAPPVAGRLAWGYRPIAD
jgi:hypothetical protein